MVSLLCIIFAGLLPSTVEGIKIDIWLLSSIFILFYFVCFTSCCPWFCRCSHLNYLYKKSSLLKYVSRFWSTFRSIRRKCAGCGMLLLHPHPYIRRNTRCVPPLWIRVFSEKNKP